MVVPEEITQFLNSYLVKACLMSRTALSGSFLPTALLDIAEIFCNTSILSFLFEFEKKTIKLDIHVYKQKYFYNCHYLFL